MRNKLKRLREQRAKLIADQRGVFDLAEKESRNLTPEELEGNGKRETEIRTLQTEIDQLENLITDLESAALTDGDDERSSSHDPKPEERTPESGMLQRFAAAGIAGLTTEERQEHRAGMQGLHSLGDTALARDLAELGVSGGVPALTLACPSRHELRRQVSEQREQRALATGVATSGAEFIPEGFWPTLTQARDQFGGLRRTRARIIETSNGNPIAIPTASDIGNAAVLIAEGGDASAEADPTTGEKNLGSYKFSTLVVKITLEMLQDSAFNLDAWIAQIFGERFGRGLSPYLVSGTGVNQPEGMVTNAGTHAAAANNAVVLDDFIKLEHSVTEPYRAVGEYAMNDSTAQAVRLLKDANGRYMLQASDIPGRPDRIGRYNVTYDNAFDDIGAGNKSVAFGDFSHFWVRDVLAMQLFRLEEMFIQNGQIGFLAFARHDSVAVNAGVDPYKVLAHPA